MMNRKIKKQRKQYLPVKAVAATVAEHNVVTILFIHFINVISNNKGDRLVS